MTHLSSNSTDFWSELAQLLAWESSSEERIEQTVKQIIADIRQQGDSALVELTNKFDRRAVSNAMELEIPHHRLKQAFDGLPEAGQKSLATAAAPPTIAHHLE